jgi:hypothetical protein
VLYRSIVYSQRLALSNVAAHIFSMFMLLNTLANKLISSKIRWRGYVWRMNGERMLKGLLDMEMSSERLTGGPRSWREQESRKDVEWKEGRKEGSARNWEGEGS